MSKLKSQVLIVIAFLTCALVGANASQAPSSEKIKAVRKELTIFRDIKVGGTVLKTGRYQVSSNADHELTFRRLIPDPSYSSQWMVDRGMKPVVVKSTPTVLEAKSDGTYLDTGADSSDVPTLKSITLEGTNVKFTIAQ